MRLIWEWSAHGQESGDLQRQTLLSLPSITTQRTYLPSHNNTRCHPTNPFCTTRHMVSRVKMPHDLPYVTQHNRMNPDILFCQIRGCAHSKQGTARPFHSHTVLLCHLNSTTHASTHSLVNHSDCATAGIYTCCSPSCHTSSKTFFSSLQALSNHCHQAHPPPRLPSPTDVIHPPSTDQPSPLSLSTRLLHRFSPPNTTNNWQHGINFSDSVYHHEPPDFRTTWSHLVGSWNLAISIFQPPSFHHTGYCQSQYYLRLH